MRALWCVVGSSLFMAPAWAGFGGGTVMQVAPKIDLVPHAVGGDPVPPISETAEISFLVDQAELLGTFADFVNPIDARATEALAHGDASFAVNGSDARKVGVAFEVVAKAFGVQFKVDPQDPSVIVMDDAKDGLPAVELYEGDRVTTFFSIDLKGPDGQISNNRFGTEAVVVFDGTRAALAATTVVASLGATADAGIVWSVADGMGSVASTGGTAGVADYDDLLALFLRSEAPQETYLFTFADVYTKDTPSVAFRAEDAVSGPGGTEVSLKNLPPHTQIRVSATAHFIDDWAGETASLSNGGGGLSSEARSDKREMEALMGTWGAIGVQTGSNPVEVVVEAASEVPFVAPADGTVIVLGAGTTVARTPAFYFSGNRVDILPDGRIYRTSMPSLGSITILPSKDGWAVVTTTTKADGTEIYATVTHATADGALGALEAWFGGLGLTTDRVAISGADLALRGPVGGSTYRTYLTLRRNASDEP